MPYRFESLEVAWVKGILSSFCSVFLRRISMLVTSNSWREEIPTLSEQSFRKKNNTPDYAVSTQSILRVIVNITDIHVGNWGRKNRMLRGEVRDWCDCIARLSDKGFRCTTKSFTDEILWHVIHERILIGRGD